MSIGFWFWLALCVAFALWFVWQRWVYGSCSTPDCLICERKRLERQHKRCE